MSKLVQAVCPTCKNRLRIPADWVHQPVRCKHCGQVLQARRPKAVPAPAPAPAPLVRPPAPSFPATAPAAFPAAAPPAGSPFSDLDYGEDTPQRRGRRGGGWLGLVVFLGVLAAAGGGLFVLWPRLQPLLVPPDDRQAANGNDASASGAVPTSRGGKPGEHPGASLDPTKPNRFPRRALVISIHNYLYANPVHHGPPGARGNSVANLLDLLSRDNSFKVPRTQCALLSDAGGRDQARPPMKPVVEKTLADFLDTSRAQDRVMVFFIGHALETSDEAYLVPIEGELDRPATLIPFKWVLDRLNACKARQKVLVLDVARLSPTNGQERPDGGPLGPKLAAALQKPPPGVQFWSACSASQRSYETDDAPEGVFLDALYTAAAQGVQNKIQHHDDPLPVEYFKDRVNQLMERELGQRKFEQVSFLAGQEQPGGAAYDANEPLPPSPALAPVPSNKESVRLVRSVLDEIGTPPVKPGQESSDLKFDALPPFDSAVPGRYADEGEADSPLRKAVQNARAVLWAVSPEVEPPALGAEVRGVRQKLRVNLSVLQEGFRAPAPGQPSEKRFKDQIEANERDVARIIATLRDAQEELENAKEMRSGEPKRWQANFDFMLARVEAEIAFLYEYQSALGRMRKEFPPRDPNLHGGWRLAATTKLQGDSAGRKVEKESRKILTKLAKDHAGTPWEVLAKREKLTALGLDWQPTR
jgi:hypothetical protein